MIPYSDLVAALRQWRVRNGLPNFGVDPGSAAVVVKAPPGPPPSFGLRPTPPPAPSAETPPLDEIEAHEIESEEMYEAEGNDFAMSFGGAPAPRDSESTLLGTPPPSPAGFGTDPGSQFPASAGYTDPGMTDPEKFSTGTATFDDDFAAEAAPAIAPVVPLDVDTEDQTLVAEDVAPGPPKPPPKKRKR